ncbi:unannotated protein [freshwater metagenome]|uniref:Unannotated protein n=1 Tax=freshwater metagenome TaxID=449393 RepID=A0A6J7XXF3_9ZZZZ
MSARTGTLASWSTDKCALASATDGAKTLWQIAGPTNSACSVANYQMIAFIFQGAYSGDPITLGSQLASLNKFNSIARSTFTLPAANCGGGGGVGPTPNQPVKVIPPYVPIGQCKKNTFCTKLDSKEAEKLFSTVRGNQGRFVTSKGLIIRPDGIPEGYTLNFLNESVPLFKGKALFQLTEDETGIITTSDSGWTGFLHIKGIALPKEKPVATLKTSRISGVALRAGSAFGSTNVDTSTVEEPAGIIFTLDIQIYPDPSPSGTYQNTKEGKTVITWTASPSSTTVGYEIYYNGALACTSKVLTCTANRLIGPKSKMGVVAIGGTKTRSDEMIPVYKGGAYALALTVYYDTAKADLKLINKKALDQLIKYIKQEGYTQIFVSGHTDPRLNKVNLALSKARANAVIAYLTPRLKNVRYYGTALADKKQVKGASSKLSLALSRRAEILVK